MESKKSSRFKNIQLFSSLTFIIVLSKLVGFVKQMVTASAFGATADTDIISLSEGLIGNTDYLLTSTLITAFSTIYIHTKTKDELRCKNFVSNTFKAIVSVMIIITAAFFVLSPLIAKIIAPTYKGELYDKLVLYIKIFAPQMILFIIIALFRSVLNANERYLPGKFVPINQSVILIVIILSLGGILGVNAIVLGSYIYCIFNVLFLLFFAKKYIHIQKGFSLKNPDLIQLMKMLLPLFLGYAMVYINQLVDKIIISGMEEGTVTALHYGATLSTLVTTFIGTFCSVIFVRVTKSISQKDDKGVSRIMNTSVNLLVSAFIFISIITVVYARDIVSIVFERGKFVSSSVSAAGMALMGYGFCFVPDVLVTIFSRYLYGNLNTKTPMINNSIGIVFNIILSIILSKYWGIFGVTFASSMAEVVSCTLNIISCRKHKLFDSKKMLKNTALWIVGTGVSVAVAILLKGIFAGLPLLLKLILVTAITGIVYAVLILPVYFDMIKKVFKKA